MLLVTDGADLGSFSTLRAFVDIAKKGLREEKSRLLHRYRRFVC